MNGGVYFTVKLHSQHERFMLVNTASISMNIYHVFIIV